MKKFLVSFVALLVLALSTAAFAQVQEFGPSFNRFTIDVPAGWTAKPAHNGDGVHVINAADDSYVILYFLQTKKQISLKEYAEGMSKKLEVENAVIEKEDDTTYSFTGTLSGQKIIGMITAEDGKLGILVMGGKDLDTVKKILDSYQDK